MNSAMIILLVSLSMAILVFLAMYFASDDLTEYETEEETTVEETIVKQTEEQVKPKRVSYVKQYFNKKFKELTVEERREYYRLAKQRQKAKKLLQQQGE